MQDDLKEILDIIIEKDYYNVPHTHYNITYDEALSKPFAVYHTDQASDSDPDPHFETEFLSQALEYARIEEMSNNDLKIQLMEYTQNLRETYPSFDLGISDENIVDIYFKQKINNK